MAEPDIRLFRGNQFIQITVRHARTHLDDGKAQFTDYEIELKTNHIAFTIKYSKVRRRYSDFVWLRDRMVRDARAITPPELPGKRLFGRFNRDFIKQRQRKLQDFLFGLVQNNVYLSHAALHLFLQSKLPVEDIDRCLNRGDEDAAETILAESECRARVVGSNTEKKRPASKHDSGYSGDLPWDLESNWLPGLLDAGVDTEMDVDVEGCYGFSCEDVFNDGNAADVESEDEAIVDDGGSSIGNVDDKALDDELNRLRISCLPAEPISAGANDKDHFESSVEYLLSEISTESENSSRRSNRSTRGSSIEVGKGRMSSQENIRSSPRKRSKRKYSRSSRSKFSNSQSSLPEFADQRGHEPGSPGSFRKPTCTNLRRALSLYESSNPHSSLLQSSLGSERFRSQDAITGRRSGASSSTRLNERTPVKRKISLNEYIIVDRSSLDLPERSEFKTSL